MGAKFRVLISAFLCEAVLTGCGAQPLPSPSALPWIETFEQPSGWQEISDPAADTQYANGRFRIRIKQPSLTQWSLAGRHFDNASVEVTAQALGGPKDNGFGLLVRCADRRNCYHFEISSDGYWRAGPLRDNRWETWSSWKADPAIRPGGLANTLRVVMKNDTFEFYVNGTLMGRQSDGTWRQGDIGLFASAFNVAGTDIAFDDLRVTAPPDP